MDSPTHDLKGLFDQLGLDSSQKGIDDFIASHSPLADDKKMIDAEFWTPQQAGFLKEQIRKDADWARVVDDLNLRLMDAVTRTGEAFLSHTRLHGRFVIRLNVSNLRIEDSDLDLVWEIVQREAAALS